MVTFVGVATVLGMLTGHLRARTILEMVIVLGVVTVLGMAIVLGIETILITFMGIKSNQNQERKVCEKNTVSDKY